MKYKEILDKIKAYESKWGKLGEGSIMNPKKTTVSHTGISETSRKENGTKMSNLNKDFIEFRKKVHSGVQANRKAHVTTINVTDLNNRFHEEITTNGTLIHAQSPLYGQERENVKYYKREGEPGNYKYYYTKEEYDATHKGEDSNQLNLFDENQNEKETTKIEDNTVWKRTPREESRTEESTEPTNREQEKNSKSDKRIEEAAKQSGTNAAINAIMNDGRIKEMLSHFEEGFSKKGWTLNYDGSISGMDEDSKIYMKTMSDWVKNFQKSTGVDIYNSKEFQDKLTEEVTNKWNKSRLNDKIDELKEITDNVKTTKIEHSAIEGEEDMNINKVQSTKKGNEILDEYRAFKERANRGNRINQLSHSSVISADELNARYEEELKNKCILVHSQNYKYYNKVELPNGTTRYFYTKAEWDAYQDGLGQQKKADDEQARKDKNVIVKTLNDPQVKEVADKEKQIEDNIEKLGKIKNWAGSNSLAKITDEIERRITRSEKYNDLKDLETKSDITDYVKPNNIAKEISKKYEETTRDAMKQLEEKYSKEGYNIEELHNKKDRTEEETKILADAYNEAYAVLKKLGDEAEAEINDAVDKVKRADKAYAKLENAQEAFEDIYREQFKKMSKSDRYLVLDILGLDDFDDDSMAERLGVSEDEIEHAYENEDYGAEILEKYETALKGFVKEFKAAVNEVNGYSSKKKDDDEEDED